MQKIANVSFKAPVDLARAVRIEAARLDMSRSAVIREALHLWLERQQRADGDGQMVDWELFTEEQREPPWSWTRRQLRGPSRRIVSVSSDEHGYKLQLECDHVVHRKYKPKSRAYCKACVYPDDAIVEARDA